ncbi:MAG: 30S ribosomal protein S6 [Candidatus Colwellbacteria bacterium]|nr:30S ribosomal protein S6 [Candidatus Colwellbacteria bacterium]
MEFMQDEELNEKNTAERVYELGYLLAPTISEEDVPAAFGNLKELIMSLRGVGIAEEMPKPIQLAYPMAKVISNVREKFNTAYFGWIKFTMETEKVLELKKKLELDPNLIRFLILKTVRENTIASKRFIRPDARRRPKAFREEGAEPSVPINKEEIDKEIDALIAN